MTGKFCSYAGVDCGFAKASRNRRVASDVSVRLLPLNSTQEFWLAGATGLP